MTAHAARLVRPTTVEAAVALLAEPGAVAVAGGVGVCLARAHARPSLLVAVDRLPELRGIASAADGTLRIGAAERLRAVAADPGLRAAWPVVAEAAESVATARIRELVTIGGNVAACDAAHDPAAGLVAAGAEVELAGHGGSRRMALAPLLAPGGPGFGGALLVAFHLPAPAGGSAYAKYLVRRVWEYACVAVGAALAPDGGARVALGSVGPGIIVVEGDRDGLAARAAAAAQPVRDVRGSAEYKRRMVAEFTRRALAAAQA